MGEFKGFPQGKVRTTPIPEAFFRELLPQIDDLDELKVIVYAFWRLEHKEGTFRYLLQEEFLQDSSFMDGLEATHGERQPVLERALRQSVDRGALLEARVTLGEGETSLYFLNDARGQAAIQAIQRGEWRPSSKLDRLVEIPVEKPNIFRLYEEHIGPLTPMIADALRDAESEFPSSWFEEAFRIAVENNARSWRYIEAILKRWQEKGRHEQEDRRDTEKARRKYKEWEDLGSGS